MKAVISHQDHPAVNGHPGGYQQQQHHQSIHPSMPWYHPSYPPMYGHHPMPPHPPTHYQPHPPFHPYPNMQMNYNYAQSSGINHPHPSQGQHPPPTHPPFSNHPHQQQHSLRHPAPIHYPANLSRPVTQNNARVSNTTNTSASINNSISLDSSNENNNRSAPTQQHQTMGSYRNRLTSKQLREALPQSVMVMNRDFVLRACIEVFGGNNTGYLTPFNFAEEDALFNSSNGLISKHIPICSTKDNNALKPGEKPDCKRSYKRYGSDKFNFEYMLTVYCKHGGWDDGCGVKGKVYRLQYGNDNDENKTTGLLYYEKVDTNNNNQPFEHDEHTAIFGSAADEYTLSIQQKAYIVEYSQKIQGEMSIGARRNVMQAMMRDKNITKTRAQEQNSEEFLARITSFIKNSKKSECSGQKFFRQVGAKDNTTGEDLYHILNHLMSSKDSEERRRQFNMDDYTRYFMSVDGELVNEMIRVHSHDHDKNTWTYIVFEFLHSPDVAELANIYPAIEIKLKR